MYQQLAQLIRDGVWLKSYLAAVMRLEHEAFQVALPGCPADKPVVCRSCPLRRCSYLASPHLMWTHCSTWHRDAGQHHARLLAEGGHFSAFWHPSQCARSCTLAEGPEVPAVPTLFALTPALFECLFRTEVALPLLPPLRRRRTARWAPPRRSCRCPCRPTASAPPRRPWRRSRPASPFLPAAPLTPTRCMHTLHAARVPLLTL